MSPEHEHAWAVINAWEAWRDSGGHGPEPVKPPLALIATLPWPAVEILALRIHGVRDFDPQVVEHRLI